MEFFLTRSYNAHRDSLMKELNIFLESLIYFILLTKTKKKQQLITRILYVYK